MSRPEIVEDVIAAAAAVPQALDRLSEEARAAWAGQLAADVAAERRAAGITVAPEAALHRALQARTDELERVRAELAEARAENASLLAVVPRGIHVAHVEWGVHAEVTRQRDEILRLTRERDEAVAQLLSASYEIEALSAPNGGAPTAPDVGSTTSAPAAGAADPLRLSGLAAPRPLATWWPASDRRGPRP
jgi:hypothetical protein